MRPIYRVCLTNRFTDLFAGGVIWDALDDILLGVLARPIFMLLLLQGLLIFFLLRLNFNVWGSQGQCCYSTEFLSCIFGPSVGAGGFFAEVASMFNLGESCMFLASSDAA